MLNRTEVDRGYDFVTCYKYIHSGFLVVFVIRSKNGGVWILTDCKEGRKKTSVM